GQDRHHLPIAVMCGLQFASDTLHGRRQNPVLEWRAVTQRTGLAGQDRNVMPGIVDRLAATEGTSMLGDDHAVLANDDAIGIGMDLDRAADGGREDRVFVVVEANGAGFGHRGWHRMEPVEGATIVDELATLFLEHVPDPALRLVDVTVRLGVGDTFVEQPGVEFLIRAEPQPRCEETLAHQPDLALDLALLPARG